MKIVLLFHVILCLIFVCVTPTALAQEIEESDVILCANVDCSDPVAKVVALVAYFPDLPDKLPLKRGDSRNVYGRIPKKKLLLIRDDKAKRLGFVPVAALYENRKLKKEKELVPVPVAKLFPHLAKKVVENVPGGVAAEAGNQTPQSTPPAEVINGTTLLLDTNGDAIDPTQTQQAPFTTKTISDSENLIEDDDEGEDDDEEEDEDDGEEEEDLEAEESHEEQKVEEVNPPKSEKQTNFETMLDDAINSEPGRDSATDEQVLKSFGENTQSVKVLPVQTKPPVLETSQTTPLADQAYQTPILQQQQTIQNQQPEMQIDPSIQLQQQASITQQQPHLETEQMTQQIPLNSEQQPGPQTPYSTVIPDDKSQDNQNVNIEGTDFPWNDTEVENSTFYNQEEIHTQAPHETVQMQPPAAVHPNLMYPGLKPALPDVEKPKVEIPANPEIVSEPEIEKRNVEIPTNREKPNSEIRFYPKTVAEPTNQETITAPETEKPYVEIPPNPETVAKPEIEDSNTEVPNYPETITAPNPEAETEEPSSVIGFYPETVTEPEKLNIQIPTNQETITKPETEKPNEDIPPSPETVAEPEIENLNSGFSFYAETQQLNPEIPLNAEPTIIPEIDTPLVENEAEQLPPLIQPETVDQVPEVPQPQEHETIEEPSDEMPGFFASFQNPFAGLFGQESVEPIEETIIPEIVPEGDCKSEAVLESSCDDAPKPQEILNLFDKTLPENSYASIYLLSTSITVLLFLLGYYFLERTRQDGPLVAKVNQLTHELQVAKAEEEIKIVDDSQSSEIRAALIEAHEEINALKKIKADLEGQLESQQAELDATTEAGLEMNRMLSDLLTQRNASDTLITSVEQLQGQLNAQQQVIDGMNKSLTEKKQENEALQAELSAAQAKMENFEEELTEMRSNLNVLLKEKETAQWELDQNNLKFESELKALDKTKKKEIDELNKSLTDLKEKLLVRESEFRALTQTIDDFKAGGNVDVKALYDVGKIKADLVRAITEKENLQERFNEELGARKLLEDHVKVIDHEVSSLRLSFETAEKEKLEAETKLTVLSNYFKEKEVQLHKELGLQEAMWAQKQGDDSTIYETMKSMQEEVESYKAQNETLKKEIVDQERGLKGQIATLEKKAHENWVAARQAERRLEESKQEAGQLRNMLTLMEKSAPDSEGKPVPRLPGEILNGEDVLPPFLADGSSPLPLPPLPPLDPSLLPPGFMSQFLPPPLGGFLPPLPSHPGEHRPPPLGRMSSPPLNRFSPGPGEFNFERMSPRPHNRSYRSPPIDSGRYHHPPSPWDERSSFRPVANQRESRNDHPDSNPSSRPSSTESLEKPTRRGKV